MEKMEEIDQATRNVGLDFLKEVLNKPNDGSRHLTKKEWRIVHQLEKLCYERATCREDYLSKDRFLILLHGILSEKSKRRKQLTKRNRTSHSSEAGSVSSSTGGGTGGHAPRPFNRDDSSDSEYTVESTSGNKKRTYGTTTMGEELPPPMRMTLRPTSKRQLQVFNSTESSHSSVMSIEPDAMLDLSSLEPITFSPQVPHQFYDQDHFHHNYLHQHQHSHPGPNHHHQQHDHQHPSQMAKHFLQHDGDAPFDNAVLDMFLSPNTSFR